MGTVQLGLDYGVNNSRGVVPEYEAHEILHLAEELGIRFLDTAAAYGKSEKVIGSYIAKQEGSKFGMISKLQLKTNKCWKTSLDNSLENLHRQKLEVLLFHSFFDFRKSENVIDEILLHKGRCYDQLGVSVYTNEELEIVSADKRFDLIQAPFNLLDNANQRQEALEECRKNGKVIHTRSVFLQGLFFLHPSNVPTHLTHLKQYLEKLHTVARDEKIPVGALALNYALSRPYIDGVLMGVDSVQQLRQNLEWSRVIISDEAMERVENIWVKDRRLLNPSLWESLK